MTNEVCRLVMLLERNLERRFLMTSQIRDTLSNVRGGIPTEPASAPATLTCSTSSSQHLPDKKSDGPGLLADTRILYYVSGML